jgi:serine/threonine-protein kinase
MLRKVEKYELLEEIGHGGMATVFRARDTRLDRLVAMKIMHPHLRAAREARVRFVREAQSVARLRHPNILEIFDNSEEDSDESYIVTELLTGPTLKDFAQAHPDLPAEIAACFCIELARALRAAHDAGVIHRDIKPENALLHEDRCIKLTDFGIAQMVDSQSFTATGQILGSPGHMAPEQVEGGDCDARTDLFSLGTVLYYLSTGSLPFAGKNPHQVLKRIVDGDFVDPIRIRPTIGGRLRAIIVKALSVDPAGRFQTAAEFESALTGFVAEIGVDDSTAMLSRFLRDPLATGEALRRQAVSHLTRLGETAAGRRAIPEALDYFNRVLSLDEGNQKALALIQRVGSHASQRRALVAFGIVLGVFGAGAMTYSLVGPDLPAPVVPEGSGLPPDAAAVFAIGPSRDSGIADARRQPLDAPVTDGAGGRRPDALVPLVDSNPDDLRPRTPSGPREVRLAPQPQNVTISIDGNPARPFGPSWNRVELDPGPHLFRVEATGEARTCCEPLEVRRTVPAGSEPFAIRLELEFRPARFGVLSNIPANLIVDGGRAAGRTNSVVQVPLGQARRRVTYTVTAPGHHPYNSEVWLRAGEIENVRVALRPAAP